MRDESGCACARHRGQVTAPIMGEARAQTSCRRPALAVRQLDARVMCSSSACRTKIDCGQKKNGKICRRNLASLRVTCLGPQKNRLHVQGDTVNELKSFVRWHVQLHVLSLIARGVLLCKSDKKIKILSIITCVFFIFWADSEYILCQGSFALR